MNTLTALVTGSEGFVGKRMVAALQERGYDVTTIDINGTPPREARDWFRHSPYRDEHFDLVVHLAAVVGGRAVIEGNPLAVAIDLSIDAELWQWVIDTNQPNVLYFSSSAAYPVMLQGGKYGVRLTESDIDLDNIKSPDLSYGLAKLVGEYQAREAQRRGVHVTIARPFSGTGPTQSLDYPLPAIIDRAVRREDPLVVWSNSVRDIIHIDDVIAISLAAVEQGIEEPFNCGTGIPTSFVEVAKVAAGLVGYSPEIVVLDDKPAGVAYRVADPTFMRSFYPHPLRSVVEIVDEMITARTEALAPADA